MELPIVATDIRGCRQVVEHGATGLLVPLRDPTALSHAVAWLAGEPELRSMMGRRGGDKARREFDQRRIIATTLALYEELLERKSPSRTQR